MPYNVTEPIAVSPAGNMVTEAEYETIYDRPPAERTALFARHAHQVGFCTWLDALGYSSGSDTTSVGHYELGWEVDQVTVGSIVTVAGGAGNPIIIALDSTNMYDSGQTSGGSGVQASYPVAGDVLEFYDGVQGWVSAKDTSVNPHRLTIEPLDSADDLDSSVNATETYSILYNLHAEGSGLPASRTLRIMKYTNTFGLIKHAFEITGHELSNAVYHETVPGDPGSARKPSYMMLQQSDIMRYERSKSYMLLLGQQTTGLTQLVTQTGLDQSVTGTEGFIPFSLANGYNDTYTVGSYAVSDFDVISTKIMDERSISNGTMFLLDGPVISNETDDVLDTYFQSDLTPFINTLIDGYSSALEGYQQGLDGGDNTVGLGYSVVRKGGITYHMKRLDEFHDIKGGGHTGYKYRNYRVATPIGFANDIRTNVARPMVGYEWKQSGKYNRQDMWGGFAGAGVGGNNSPFGPAVNEVDSLRKFMISHIAGHWACGNSLVVQRPA
jgi:hypothetical protein